MADTRAPASLRALQDQFHRLVTAPESVEATLVLRGETAASLDGFVRGDARLSAVARLDVYANMYFFRILDVLRDAYPKVVAALGDDRFHNLVTAYLAACPPSHYSIAAAGDRLPAFLQTHAFTASKPWLPALARLERAYVTLFDGPDAAPLTVTRVRELGAESMAALTLAPIPCHALLTHDFAIAALWSRLDRGEAIGDVAMEGEAVVVWRDDVTVFHRRLDADEVPLLRLVQQGTTVAALCEAADAGADVSQAALRVFSLLFRWVGDGLVAVTE